MTPDPTPTDAAGRTRTGVVGWRAYYTNGREYDSTRHAWTALPDDGVLVVVLYYADDALLADATPHRIVLDGEDWYWHVPGTDLFGATTDTHARVIARYPGAVVKRGKWTDVSTFYATKEHAYDADLP